MSIFSSKIFTFVNSFQEVPNVNLYFYNNAGELLNDVSVTPVVTEEGLSIPQFSYDGEIKSVSWVATGKFNSSLETDDVQDELKGQIDANENFNDITVNGFCYTTGLANVDAYKKDGTYAWQFSRNQTGSVDLFIGQKIVVPKSTIFNNSGVLLRKDSTQGTKTTYIVSALSSRFKLRANIADGAEDVKNGIISAGLDGNFGVMRNDSIVEQKWNQSDLNIGVAVGDYIFIKEYSGKFCKFISEGITLQDTNGQVVDSTYECYCQQENGGVEFLVSAVSENWSFSFVEAIAPNTITKDDNCRVNLWKFNEESGTQQNFNGLNGSACTTVTTDFLTDEVSIEICPKNPNAGSDVVYGDLAWVKLNGTFISLDGSEMIDTVNHAEITATDITLTYNPETGRFNVSNIFTGYKIVITASSPVYSE